MIEYLHKKDKHVFIMIVAANTVSQIYFTLIDYKQDNNFVVSIISECAKTIMYIFMNGPLKVYLDIKEGKTSAKKIIEEYEDERNILH